jgi:hypothetical protein
LRSAIKQAASDKFPVPPKAFQKRVGYVQKFCMSKIGGWGSETFVAPSSGKSCSVFCVPFPCHACVRSCVWGALSAELGPCAGKALCSCCLFVALGVPAGVTLVVPTAVPTAAPIGVPACVPTGVPAGVPTDVPDSTPAGFPTGVPETLRELVVSHVPEVCPRTPGPRPRSSSTVCESKLSFCSTTSLKEVPKSLKASTNLMS